MCCSHMKSGEFLFPWLSTVRIVSTLKGFKESKRIYFSAMYHSLVMWGRHQGPSKSWIWMSVRAAQQQWDPAPKWFHSDVFGGERLLSSSAESPYGKVGKQYWSHHSCSLDISGDWCVSSEPSFTHHMGHRWSSQSQAWPSLCIRTEKKKGGGRRMQEQQVTSAGALGTTSTTLALAPGLVQLLGSVI